MEFQHNPRHLQFDGEYKKEDCSYNENFSSCGSSFASAGPMSPSPLSSRRPSLLEEELLYIAEPAIDSRYFDLPQNFLPVSTVDPCVFEGDELGITLNYQIPIKFDTNAVRFTDCLQLDHPIYRQTPHGIEGLSVNMSDRHLLDTSNIPAHTRASLNDFCPATPQMSCQEYGTIDPTQTHLQPEYLETDHGVFKSSNTATLFEPGSQILGNCLYSSPAQIMGFRESSPESSSGWSNTAQTGREVNTIPRARGCSSIAPVGNSSCMRDDGTSKSQRNNSTYRVSTLSPASASVTLASKIKKLDIKTRSKSKTSIGSSNAVSVGVAEKHKLPCGYQYRDGSICKARFKRKEHLKRHREIHECGKANVCPDPECKGKDFKGRADNKKQHIIKTHLLYTECGQRNRRWTKEEAYKWNAGDEWEKAQVKNAETRKLNKHLDNTRRERKLKEKKKLLRLSTSELRRTSSNGL